MRQRSFKIIRLTELEGSSFLFNNVEVTYVGTCPETGISFYCNTKGANYGVRVYPDGRKAQENPCGVKHGKPYAHGKNEYLMFKDAFGKHKGIYVSHAVWMAAGRIIPPGMTMDHIDGCTTDNRLGNLRCMDIKDNQRDGGFRNKLCNQGFIPVRIPRHYLLRYYSRMAVIKKSLKRWRYRKLTREDLTITLYWPDDVVMQHFHQTYNIKIDLL